MSTASTIAPTRHNVGRKRRPPKKNPRTFRARFAMRLHELAGEKTNKEIADALGVTPQSVGSWFRGEDVPAFDYWPGLARVFGVAVRDLLPPE